LIVLTWLAFAFAPELRRRLLRLKSLQTETCATDTFPHLSFRFSRQFGSCSSLCNLSVLCASVVEDCLEKTTTETQRTQRLHREIRLFVQSPSDRQIDDLLFTELGLDKRWCATRCR